MFSKKYNSILHVAFVLYVFAITSTAIGILLGGMAAFDLFPKAGLVGLGNAVSTSIP